MPDWTYEQLFNNLNNGDLNGQDDWIGAIEFDVQIAEKYEGAKAVKWVGIDYKTISRQIAPVSSGIMYIAMMLPDVNAGMIQFLLEEELGAGNMATVLMRESQIEYYEEGGWKDYTEGGFSGTSNSQWYVVAIEFDATTNKYKINIHDGTSWKGWTAWLAYGTGDYSNVDKIRFNGYSDSVGYFDTITPNDPIVPPPPPIFPEAIYSPRTKENKAGIVYDPEKTDIGYAEDIINLDLEVVAIEDFLLPQYIFAHQDNVIPVAVAGTFVDIPFDEAISTPKVSIEHDHESNPEQFKIKKAGVYLINWVCSFEDSAGNPDSHIVTRVVRNGAEIPGSLIEKDVSGIPQSEKDKIITNSILVTCALDDILKLQFTSDDLTVSLASHATYGVHKDTATINIIRIA